TITSDIEPEDTDPTTTVLKAIAEQGEKVGGAIVRLQISLPAEIEGQLRDNDIRDALKETYYFTIARDIKREARLRLGQFTAEEMTPLEALKSYLETRKVAPAQAKLLLEYGEKLIERAGTK
ncbi:MAG: exonuclease SbcCD subunit D, partial [Chloroflexi bacterium]|nr:exonuclease SbcCD subunit D [Chloroflexota bacterium]